MERIIRSSELKSKMMSEAQREFMKNINEHPDFDPALKEYKFIKAVKTNTDVHGWIFELNGMVYVATQKLKWRGPETVNIYEASEKGVFDHAKPIATYPGYCDIEAAVDTWIAEKK
jgi:hypothetical protein